MTDFLTNAASLALLSLGLLSAGTAGLVMESWRDFRVELLTGVAIGLTLAGWWLA